MVAEIYEHTGIWRDKIPLIDHGNSLVPLLQRCRPRLTECIFQDSLQAGDFVLGGEQQSPSDLIRDSMYLGRLLQFSEIPIGFTEEKQ